MKRSLLSVRLLLSLLLSGLNPKIQNVVSLFISVVLNKRKNLSYVTFLFHCHKFLLIKLKGFNVWKVFTKKSNKRISQRKTTGIYSLAIIGM